MTLRVRVLAVLIAVIAGMPVLLPARVARAQALGVTEYSIPSGFVGPQGIATGPDGNLWFSEDGGPNIGRITPSGAITEYAIPSNTSSVQTMWITRGPDSNMWFSDWGNNAVGKIATSGTVGAVTEYPIPTAGAGPTGIVTGSDGNLWFTESSTDKIGRVTTGGSFAEYSISSGSGVSLIAAGPDHNLWFTETSLNKIGTIKTDGTGLTEFSTASGSQPNGIIAGPDGNLWFTELGTNNIGKMSTSGSVLNEYSIPTSGANPQDITVGPDANLWFTEFNSNNLGEITTSGAITEYSTGTSSNPQGITAGPDGNIWYTGFYGPTLGRFSLNPCAGLTDTAAPTWVGPGAPVSVSVTLTSCGVATLNATTTTTTSVPPGCPAAPTIPPFTSSLSYAKTDPRVTAFGAPSCPGEYTVMSQTTVGATVLATAQATYTVLAVGDGVLFNTDSRPSDVTAGSDGNVWYTDYSNNLNRVTPSGAITSFTVLAGSGQQLTSGPDGNLYVVSASNNPQEGIAQVNLHACCRPVLAWQVPASGALPINDIEPGIDGNVWFAAGANGSGIVGFVTPNAKFKQFKLPAGSGAPISITAGSDNAMWFTLDSGHVGRITTTGAVTTFPVPGNLGMGCNQGCAALGPDGNVWFSGGDPNTSQNYLVSISPSGVVREFPTPTTSPNVDGITAAADGNIWFNEARSVVCPHFGGVGRVTPAGVVTEFGAGCNDLNDQFNIVPGPDGNLWNAAYYGIGINLISVGASGACTPLSATAAPPTVAHGATESVAATIANCSTTPQLMKLTNKTIRPSGCGSPVTTATRVPLWAQVQTVVSNTFTASRCRGTYTVKLSLSAGGTVVATTTVAYKVT